MRAAFFDFLVAPAEWYTALICWAFNVEFQAETTYWEDDD